ncbi:Ipo11 [Columba livia]|nr:Ipo11 [Columba livia]
MDINSASSIVLQVLTQATSQDTAVLKPAEEQLKQWETQPGFYSVLLNIFTNHTLDVNVRWLAVLYFKNGIDRYWRRVAPHALSEEEKATLRAGLITNFNEPVNQIATQISVLIAKVARVDCPRQWPELIPTLLESVKVQDDLRQHRALLTFYHVTKTLASKRLAADRKLFYDLASGIYSFAFSLWNHHTDTFLQQICAGDEAAATNSLERTLLSLKGRSVRAENVCRDRLEKTIILFTKVLLDFLDQHPFSFTPLIQRSLEFAVSYVFTEAGEGIVFERFIVQCMNLIKMIVKNYAYKPSKNIEAVEETGGDSWKYSLRPCTEVLFIDIFHEYNQTLSPVLLEMVHSLQGPTNMEDTSAILIKDAVFNAVGLAAYELFDSVDFDQWFKNQLLAELQVSHNRYKPIRRRVIWLIGQWISVKFKSDLRPMLYEAIRNLLQDQDLVSVLFSLNGYLPVDDFEFRTDQFLPYLEPMFTLLFQLLQEVTQCDTKMHVLHVLSCVIERVNMQIRPYVDCLIQYLPLLWKQSEEHNMLRCAILTTLIHLVQGLGADSKNLYPFLLPVIQLSTDVSQPPHVYLLEDGLELWLVTLENSPCLTSDLLRIFQNMPALLDMSSENLKNCFKIINAYIFLSSSTFLQTYATDLCRSFCELLKDITTEGQVQVLKVVENALKVNPVLGPQVFQPLLPSIFRGIIDGERYPVVMSTYLGIMGRVLLQNASFFSVLLSQMACELAQELDQVLGNMIEMWVDRMDNITQPERRKLSALALLSLLPSLNSFLSKQLQILGQNVRALVRDKIAFKKLSQMSTVGQLLTKSNELQTRKITEIMNFRFGVNYNPWNCSCKMLGLLNWLASSPISVKIHCQNPPRMRGRPLHYIKWAQFANCSSPTPSPETAQSLASVGVRHNPTTLLMAWHKGNRHNTFEQSQQLANAETKYVAFWEGTTATSANPFPYGENAAEIPSQTTTVLRTLPVQIPAQTIPVNRTVEGKGLYPTDASLVSLETPLLCTQQVEKLSQAFDILLAFFILACTVILFLTCKIIQFRQKLKVLENSGEKRIEYYGFYQPGSVIQDKFCGIINISVEGLHDVMAEDPETGTYKDCMLMSHFEEPKATEDEEPPTEQDKRKKMLALKDPVHTVSLQQFIYEKLKAQQELLGEQGFQALMETVDTEVVAQLQEFLQGF